MRRRIALVSATVLLAGLFSAVTVTPALACGKQAVRTQMKAGALEVIGLRTLHVVVEPDQKTYRIGDMAKIHVTVTRPAHEDPLQQGIPMDPPFSMPVEDVGVGIGLHIGEVFLFGYNMTDAEGKTTVKIKIENYSDVGPAIAYVYAWKNVVEVPCLRVEENGHTQVPKIFNVARNR